MNIKIIILIPFFLFPAFTYSQDYSTWGDIYDFEVWDVFHYGVSDDPPGYLNFDKIVNVTILSKDFSNNQDTVFYIKFIQSLTKSYGNWVYDEEYDSIWYTNLSEIFIADSVFYTNWYNGRKISLNMIVWSPYDYTHDYYADGCGNTLRCSWSAQPPYSEHTKEMIYFKKGDEEWGTPNNIVGISDNMTEKTQIMLFPNPARENINLTINKDLQINQVQIYNNVGKLVLNQSNSFDNINISNLSPGLYIVQIIGDAWTATRKLIVK